MLHRLYNSNFINAHSIVVVDVNVLQNSKEFCLVHVIETDKKTSLIIRKGKTVFVFCDVQTHIHTYIYI